MNLKETLQTIETVTPADELIAEISNLYGVSLPHYLEQILSISPDTTFYDDMSILRKLSHREIVTASQDMQVDFLAINLMPIFDIGENDYIAFDFTAQEWCKFNIVDEVKFDRKSDLTNFF